MAEFSDASYLYKPFPKFTNALFKRSRTSITVDDYTNCRVLRWHKDACKPLVTVGSR